jgi:polyhydroxyalkanoate synthase
MSDKGASTLLRTGKRIRNLLGLLRRGKPEVGTTPADVVHSENKWRLLRYHGKRTHQTPVLLVPSLINRHYVLDLQKGRSFAEWLVARGHDVFMIDWGTPGDEDRYLTFDHICDRYLGRAVRKAARYSADGSVHLLGYCLGGTLTTIYTAAYPEHVASMVALAAPISFDDDGLLSRWSRTPSMDVGAVIDAYGNAPWPLMQASFHMLKPTLNLSKAVTLVDRAWDDQFLDGFLAIERWGSDNVSFPGECYRRYINELYGNNALLAGTFDLSGNPVRLENIDCPTLVVTFEHDHIVPHASASVLLDRISSDDKEHIHLNGGHVGAVISRKASSSLWPQLSDWWVARDVPDYGEGDEDDAPDPEEPEVESSSSSPGPRPLSPSTKSKVASQLMSSNSRSACSSAKTSGHSKTQA